MSHDRATLRRMAPVLRAFSPLMAHGNWLPYSPTLAEKVYASCWQGAGVRLWTIVNRSGRRSKSHSWKSTTAAKSSMICGAGR